MIIKRYHILILIMLFALQLFQLQADFGTSIGGGGRTVTSNAISLVNLNYAADGTTAGQEGLFVISTAGYYYLTDDILLSQAPTGSTSIPIIYIKTSNIVLDLGTKTIGGNSFANNVLAAIQVADGISNVCIKNGTISGISSTNNSANGFGILINNGATSTISSIHMHGLAIFSCGYFGISIHSCNIAMFNNICCTNNGPTNNAATTGTQANKAGGAYLDTIKSGTIRNCCFSNNAWNTVGTPTAANHIVGMYLTTCKNIQIEDSHFDNNNNTSDDTAAPNFGLFAVGLWLLNTANCKFTNVCADQNSRTGSSSTSGNGTKCFGFYLQGTSSPFSSANIFCNCEALNNSGTIFSAGFAMDGISATSGISGSNGNRYTECIATLNSATPGSSTTQGNAYGFYCVNTSGNVFDSCAAENNTVPGGSTSATVRTAVGFYSAGSFSNQFVGCHSNFNNISTAHGAVSRSSVAFAAGFQLGDTGSNQFETGAIVRKCIANGNTTIGSLTFAPAYGVLILPSTGTVTTISARTIIEECFTTGNVSQGTTADIGLSFGIVDQTPGYIANGRVDSSTGSTTFMRANVSIGHGRTFSGTQMATFATNNMNYYIDFDIGISDPLNSIKEVVLANLNGIGDTNLTLFNWSFFN